MLGAAGCLVPELLTKVRAPAASLCTSADGGAQAGVADLPTWADAGKAEYFTDPVTLVLIQGILFNWVEVLRWKDMKNPGSVHEVQIWQQALACMHCADAPLAPGPDLQGQQGDRHRGRLPGRPLLRPVQLRR